MNEYSYTFNKADIYTGKYTSGRYKPFEPVIDVDGVIEVLQREAYDIADDAAEGYLDNLTRAEVKSLGECLTRVFRRWARECGEEPTFGEVNHIRRYDLRTGREV